MPIVDTFQQHRELCDELYALVQEENAFLQQHHRAPDAALLERKRKLLTRLDPIMTEMRGAPRGALNSPTHRRELDQLRSRILQILQLERENEQLLLRASLTTNRAPATPVAAPSMLGKIYGKR